MKKNNVFRAVFFILFIISILNQNSEAKDLSGRVGIGFTSRQLSTDTPALSMKFAFSNNHSLQLSCGINTGGDNNLLIIGGRFFRNAYQQDNINFFLGLGVFVIREEISNVLTSGFEVSGIFGTEFFFESIEPLGFMILAGVGLESSNTGITFSTSGQSFLTAGIHYYF